MGKVKRARQKTKASVKQPTEPPLNSGPINVEGAENNVFSGINLAFKNKLQADDLQSLRSFKSVKSHLGLDKQITKKDKLKMRKQLLKSKIDFIKEEVDKVKRKRKKNAIIGDIQPMSDALSSLLKPVDYPLTPSRNTDQQKPKKTFEKSRVRQKKLKKNIAEFKLILKHPEFKKDPKAIIAEHIQAMVDRDNNKI